MVRKEVKMAYKKHKNKKPIKRKQKKGKKFDPYKPGW